MYAIASSTKRKPFFKTPFKEPKAVTYSNNNTATVSIDQSKDKVGIIKLCASQQTSISNPFVDQHSFTKMKKLLNLNTILNSDID